MVSYLEGRKGPLVEDSFILRSSGLFLAIAGLSRFLLLLLGGFASECKLGCRWDSAAGRASATGTTSHVGSSTEIRIVITKVSTGPGVGCVIGAIILRTIAVIPTLGAVAAYAWIGTGGIPDRKRLVLDTTKVSAAPGNDGTSYDHPEVSRTGTEAVAPTIVDGETIVRVVRKAVSLGVDSIIAVLTLAATHESVRAGVGKSPGGFLSIIIGADFHGDVDAVRRG
jgi:hypothetical protein